MTYNPHDHARMMREMQHGIRDTINILEGLSRALADDFNHGSYAFWRNQVETLAQNAAFGAVRVVTAAAEISTLKTAEILARDPKGAK